MDLKDIAGMEEVREMENLYTIGDHQYIPDILGRLDTWGSNRQLDLDTALKVLSKIPVWSISVDEQSNHLWLVFNRLLTLTEAVELMQFRPDDVRVIDDGTTLMLWWD